MFMNKPKILVGIVTYEGKDYIFPQCYNAVRSFDYDNYDVLIVDNSKSKKYSTILKRRGYRTVVHVERGANSREALADSQNYIRAYAIEKGYDYVLLVESDLVPDRQAINRLLAHQKRVVGSFYLLGTGKFRYPCIFTFQQDSEHNALGTRPVGVTVQEGKKLLNVPEINEWFDSGLRECAGCGFGTTLIETSLLREFPIYNFYSDKTTHHSDVWWYYTLNKNNVPIYVDTSVNIPHYPTDWEKVEDR